MSCRPRLRPDCRVAWGLGHQPGKYLRGHPRVPAFLHLTGTITESSDPCPWSGSGTETLIPTSTSLGSKLGQGAQETQSLIRCPTN